MIDTAVTKPNGKTPHVIGPPPVTGRKAVPRRLWLAGIAVLLVAVSAGAWFWLRRSQSAPVYVTVPLAKQDLLQTVTASGTVNPQNTVSVGTQVSGTIQSIYVDFNSRVHVGEILAKLDPSTVQTQLDQALDVYKRQAKHRPNRERPRRIPRRRPHRPPRTRCTRRRAPEPTNPQRWPRATSSPNRRPAR